MYERKQPITFYFNYVQKVKNVNLKSKNNFYFFWNKVYLQSNIRTEPFPTLPMQKRMTM